MKNLEPGKLAAETLAKLVEIFGEGGVSASDSDRGAYARDLWPRHQIDMLMSDKLAHPPDAIVWPTDENQIAKLFALASAENFAVIPFGAGSGVCGGTLPLSAGVVLDIKKMDRIIEVNDKALTVTAEAGIIGQHLEMELNRKGYTMGHFPSSIYCSSLGGYLAARSAGQLSAKYGKIEDMAMSIRVVLPDGRIAETVCAPRSAAGPNWAQLFIGSEGTFGVITSAKLRIHPYPQSRLFRAFTFDGVGPALESMRMFMRAGITPSAVRLYDELDTILIGGKKDGSVEDPISFDEHDENPVKKTMHAISESVQNMLMAIPKATGRVSEYIRGKCLLVLTFEGTPEMTAAEHAVAVAICKQNGGADEGEEPARRWWNNRYNVSYNQSKVFHQGSFVDTMDVATTWDKVEDLYRAVRKAVSKHAFIMAHFSHAYMHGCCIYFSMMSRGSDEADAVRTYNATWKAALDEVVRFGATVTHHHGVGMHKAEHLKRELGPLTDVFADMKKALDPQNFLNPGKLGLPARENKGSG